MDALPSCPHAKILPEKKQAFLKQKLVKANFLKNVEVEAVILLFIIDFLSFWLLRQYRPGGQKRRENLNVN